MHLRPTLLLLPLLSTYVASTTATVTVTMTAPAPCFTPIGSEYYLKTQVIEGGNSSKSGLYLEGYHTGAGENDAVLVPNTSDHTLAKGWLDGSYQVPCLDIWFTALLELLACCFILWVLIPKPFASNST